MMKTKLMTVAIIGIAMMTGMASADLITPTGVTEFSHYGGRIPGRTIDGSGMSGPGNAGDTHLSTGLEENFWCTAVGDQDGWITFDLGALYDVTTMRIWNWNSAGDTGRGIKNMTVLAGPDLGSMVSQGAQLLTEATGADSYTGEDIAVSFSGVRYITFDITDNFNADAIVTGLSEVRFEGTFTPIAAPPFSPDPSDSANLVAQDKTLAWATSGYPFSGFKVYLGTDPCSLSDVTATDGDADDTNNEFVPASALAEGTTYYWRVEAIDPNGGFPVAYSTDTLSFKTTVNSAGSMITPVTATATTEMTGFNGGRLAVDTINSNGLTVFGHNTFDGDMWMAAAGYAAQSTPAVEDYDPEIIFDLGAYYDVDVLREWGYNSSNLPVFAPDEVNVYTSTDDITYTLAGTINFSLAPGVDGYLGDMHAVNYTAVRYIKLDPMTSQDGAIFGPTETGLNGGTDGRSLCGLSEIRFYGTLQSPLVHSEPTPLTVAAGQPAVFTIVAENMTDYQWYKDGSPIYNGDSGGDVSGADSTSLTIANVDVTDEGFYHCDISGDQSVESASAQLMTKRLVGHWDFDGDDLTDSVDLTVAGAPTHDGAFLPGANSTYVAGVDGGSALSFGSDPNNIVSITSTEAFYSFYTRGYTVSFWVKPPDDALPVSLFSKWDGTGFSHYRSGLGSKVNLDENRLDGALTADEWNFFVLTYDADSGAQILYRNGVSEVWATIALPASGNSTAAVEIGSPSAGVMDDVKLYSKALSYNEIAQEYLDTVGGDPICASPPAMDIAPVGALDCKVNILDFAALAGAWLEDGNVYAP